MLLTKECHVISRDLHVIEVVDASNPSSGGQPPAVELTIKPALVRRQRRNMMLVLKSHCSAVWVISTRGLRGTLDIVVSVCILTLHLRAIYYLKYLRCEELRLHSCTSQLLYTRRAASGYLRRRSISGFIFVMWFTYLFTHNIDLPFQIYSFV